MPTRQISETIEAIFEASKEFISDVTDKILPLIEDLQNRSLDMVYPVLYIDTIHYSVRDNWIIRKLAAYVIFAPNHTAFRYFKILLSRSICTSPTKSFSKYTRKILFL